MKFSGRSFGGHGGGGTTIYSPNHKLLVFKNKKTKEHESLVKKRIRIPFIFTFFVLSLPLDTFYFLIQFRTDLFLSFSKTVFETPAIKSIPSPPLLPLWIVYPLLFVLLGSNLAFLYYFGLRGVATWHGCEHKTIQAAEENDLDNVRNYSRINDRCGGCYMFTVYSFIILYWLFTSHILGWYVPVGVMTLAFVVMIIENKFFHKYNIVGIRFGRLLQKYITTKEPLDYQVDICVKGMKELIEKEEEYGKQKG